MSLSATRWHVIAESNFAWEREALDWLRNHLPDRDSWHVWTNFEFIDDEGKVSEVDALVLSSDPQTSTVRWGTTGLPNCSPMARAIRIGRQST